MLSGGHVCFLCSALEILQVHGVTLDKLIHAMPKQFECFAEDSVLAGRMEIEGWHRMCIHNLDCSFSLSLVWPHNLN